MKIWWCQEHETLADVGDDHCDMGVAARCRMVAMRLIPDRFLVATVNVGGIAHWMIPVSALNEESE